MARKEQAMSGAVIVFLVAWLVIGGATSVVMRRHGHDGFAWLVLGLVFGPFAPLFAIEAWSRREPVDVVAPGADRRGGGPVDVLVGVDGSAESAGVVRAAADLLGPRLGRLAVAVVVPHDAGAGSDVHAAERLRALDVGRPEARLEVLHGRPAPTLLEHMAEGGYDLLAVGARGAGLSSVLGSTARELATTSKLPVLVVGHGEAAA
jgi:nucleotide-binding universal stress UspA family protein